MTLKLYYAPGACSLAPHIVLEEAGATYQSERVDLRAGQQKSPEYLAVNPKGAVPALHTDRGVLTENPVILGWIANTHPEAGLAPAADSFEYAELQSFNTFLGASVHPNLGRLLFSRPPLEGPAREAAQTVAVGKLRLIEDSLFRGPWATGDAFTIADPYLYVFERWASQAGLISDGSFPRMSGHIESIQTRPAVRRALEQEGLEPI